VQVASAERFHGRVALVTGSSSGNGRAIALRLAREGASVVCSDVRAAPRPGGFDEGGESPTHELITADGGKAVFQECDASDRDAVDAVVDRAEAEFGGLHAAVLNAGVFLREASILEETDEEHARTMAVNEGGVWHGIRAAAESFVRSGDGGKIVCVASMYGLIGAPNSASYCSSKGAVVNLVKAAAIDLAPHRISVNAICPGFIATAMLGAEMRDPGIREAMQAQTPFPRLGTPEDVAAAAAFLASDDAEWITGTSITVDGGSTAI
jgi:NAD(P)-dependent dehydrogenase (short-subunit alcohol dehydrogenase family)